MRGRNVFICLSVLLLSSVFAILAFVVVIQNVFLSPSAMQLSPMYHMDVDGGCVYLPECLTFVLTHKFSMMNSATFAFLQCFYLSVTCLSVCQNFKDAATQKFHQVENQGRI